MNLGLVWMGAAFRWACETSVSAAGADDRLSCFAQEGLNLARLAEAGEVEGKVKAGADRRGLL